METRNGLAHGRYVNALVGFLKGASYGVDLLVCLEEILSHVYYLGDCDKPFLIVGIFCPLFRKKLLLHIPRSRKMSNKVPHVKHYKETDLANSMLIDIEVIMENL